MVLKKIDLYVLARILNLRPWLWLILKCVIEISYPLGLLKGCLTSNGIYWDS